MNILITGAAGLLGSHLVEILIKEGHNIIGIDNLSLSYQENVIKHSSHNFIEGDCLDYEFMDKWTQDVDLIINCACLPYEGLSIPCPHQITKSVFDIASIVGSLAAKNKVKKVINFSSMARYGEGSEKPFRESDLCHPVDPYGTAKLAGEQLLNTMSDIYDFSVCHIVPHNVFGIRGKWNDPYRGVIYIMINKILRDEKMVIYGDGEQRRSFTFADDALSFFPELIKSFQNKEIFNIGSDDSETFVSINELANIIIDKMGKGNKIYMPKRIKEVSLAWCSAQKVKERFGWQSKKSLERGIEEIIEYIKENGSKDWDYHMNIEIPDLDFTFNVEEKLKSKTFQLCQSQLNMFNMKR